jgi:hypothetical protein
VDADDGLVRDNSGISRAVRPVPVLVAGLAVLLASTTAALVGFHDPADAATVVTSASRALVVLPSGAQHEAVVGERLPSGAVLRTALKGGARLTAAGRDVYVGGLSTVRVLDGVHEVLQRGQVMVDSRDGAQLRLDVDGGRVLLAQDTLARVERGQVLRVGVFSGGAAVGVDGRQVTTKVPALHQVTQQYGALPASPTALFLVKDDWEVRLAADLVSNDNQLDLLQEGLRGTEGTVVLESARTELLNAATDPIAASDQGERALSIAVAQVGALSASPVTNLGVVRTARTEGGSWGVVAAIVRARVNDVSGALSGSLDTPTQPTQAIGDPGIGPVLPGTSPTPAPTDVTPTSAPPTKRPPTSGPPTSPPPSASPGAVQQVIDTITKLLPTPPPSPLVQVPLPVVSPSLQIGPLRIG